jgi:hypothetical protein
MAAFILSYRRPILCLLLLAWLSSACSRHGQQAECGLNVNTAPDIRGMRLGMTVDELQAVRPQFDFGKDVSFSKKTFFGCGSPRRPGEQCLKEDIDELAVEVTDGRVSRIAAYYPEGGPYETGREFITDIVLKLNLPTSGWEEVPAVGGLNISAKRLKCEDASIEAGFLLGKPYIVLRDEAAARTFERRKQEEDSRAQMPQELERTKRKQRFIP